MFKKRFTTKDCSRRAFWLGAAALCALRLALCAFQQAYIWVGGAPLDDELMFRAANAITDGQWLGSYDYLTLSKSMFFPVWLAFLHALRIPYLMGGVLLWLGAALLAAQAFAPLLPRRKSRLALFGALAFLPSSWAAYTLRVYRDNIFPALCLIFFAGMAATALRAVFCTRRQAPLWPWLLAAGAGLGAAYLSREDAGLFLLPFAVLGSGIILAVLVQKRRWLCAAAQLIPYGMLAAGVLAFCGLNYAHYGYWGLSDFSEGAFADAMGAMSRVETSSAEPLLSVPTDAREKLYAAVPELRRLQYWLEEDSQLQNDFRDPELDDYRAGSFYWAIRRAAQFEGIYETAQTAQAYWAAVAERVNAACDDGTLPVRVAGGGRRSGTTQPIRAAYVAPTLAETAKGFGWVLAFADCAPYETLRSIGTEEDFARWTGYLGSSFNSAAEAGKDTPYYSPWQKLVFGAMELWRWGYAVGLALAFLGALARQLRALPGVLRAPRTETLVPWLLLFGLLGMALLRCAMIAFVEVSSFGIGTSTMYLATVHPLLVLYAAAGLFGAKNKPKGGEAVG